MKHENELYAFRRHLRSCQFFGPGGREIRSDKCDCPFHVDGIHRGQRVRQSLHTRSRQHADPGVAKLIQTLDAKLDAQCNLATGETGPSVVVPKQRAVSEAIERFLATHGEIDEKGEYRGDSEYNTYRKYRSSLRAWRTGLVEWTNDMVDALEGYRRTRTIGGVTWKTERQLLITFFGFCVKRKGSPQTRRRSCARRAT